MNNTFIKKINPAERVFFLIFYLFLFMLHASNLYAEQKDDFAEKQKKFISNLYRNGRYFDCIAETERLISYEKKPENNGYIYLINTCYYKGSQYKALIYSLKDKSDPIDLFLLSHSYYNAGNSESAIDALNKTDYAYIDQSLCLGLFKRRAEILLGGYKYKTMLAEIDAAQPYSNLFNSRFNIMDYKKDIQQYTEIGLKSKWISVSLSAIVPGTGQVYSGRIIDGLISFAAVAGSAFGAVYYHKKDKPLSYTLSFFTVLFYSGNLYGAYNSAEYANKRINQDFVNKVTEKYNLKYDPAEYVSPGLLE